MVGNVEIVGSSTTTDKVTEDAFCPRSGVKMQFIIRPVAVDIIEGFHVPVIPFAELVGKVGAILFLQSGAIGLKTGTLKSIISTDITTELAHWPTFGVKV